MLSPYVTALSTALSDAGYLAEVLCVTSTTSEAEIDQELAAKATALGISVTRPPTADNRNNCSASDSALNIATYAHTASTESSGTTDTALTAQSSSSPEIKRDPTGGAGAGAEPTSNANPLPGTRARSRSLNFSQYDKYLAQIDPNLEQPKFLKHHPPPPDPAPSIFSVSTRKNYISFKNGIKAKVRWRKRPVTSGATISCICCREDYNMLHDVQPLPCGHTYCRHCLQIMINQSTTDESKMPPRCCTQPIPGSVIKVLLTREEQQSFLKAVLQFSTPWETRIFCPNINCGEFIPPKNKIDPKHPFDVTCRKCSTAVCVMCKRDAHALGQDCPYDWELDQVLRIGEKSGWRRCWKCKTLVELTQGCTHMTCRCKAQFCYICGAVWDNSVGCPNFCNGEEELERRRIEEEAREAEVEAEKAAQEAAAAAAEVERQDAMKRTRESIEFSRLKADQVDEMERFLTYERKAKWIMWTRHSENKLAVMEKYSDQTEKMKERHAKTEQHLEERQIAAEMELQKSLEQSERSVRIRVKHMEAYCKALGRNPATTGMPPRVVTERDLIELGQQHNVLEGMARLHQARINVLRDRQAKRMEELLERQETELEKLEGKRDEDIEDLAAEFAHEEDALSRAFQERKARLQRRWELSIEILRIEMEKRRSLKYAAIPTPEWPVEASAGGSQDAALTTVVEE